MEVSREQALAYRLDVEGLCERAPGDSDADVARMLCLQNTPPGVAGQALSARVDDIGEDDVLRALEDDRTVPAVVTAPRPIRRGR